MQSNHSGRRPVTRQAAAEGSVRQPPTSRKREREEFNEDANHHDYSSGETYDEVETGTKNARSSKRSRQAHQGNPPPLLPPRYLVIHRVQCEGGENHTRHKQVSDYTDTPRLFAGDSKASAVRGKWLLSNIEEHLEENPEISIVIYKTYSCNDYHEVVKDQFERLQIPKNIEFDVIAQLRSYFFSLKHDGPHAESLSEEMTINSDDLKDAMANLEAASPGTMANWQDARNMKAPYLHLYHCRGSMQVQASEILDATQEQHVKVLLNYVETAFGREYADADAQFAHGVVSRVHFPKLFGPNEVVVTWKNDQPMAYVSENCPETDRLPLDLSCGSWTFDGMFRRERTSLSVDWPSPLAAQIQITDLSTYPLKYDTFGLEKRLRRRGEEFWKCRKRNFISYIQNTDSFEVQTSNPRYMIDLNTYRQMHNDESRLPPQKDDLGQEAMDYDRPPGGPFALLLPANILGFGFHDKKWRSLSVENLGPIPWNTQAFERLVLKPHKKELVKALVTVHIATSKSTDVIEGKGNGLIILLHGGPGTGKTLTAESVAELTKKPLYRVTCGDIGTNPEDVEKYLESVLYIGQRWGCCVLLDEADVFLEERTQTDLQRNALVSVFLRVLEYYEGILILTSNRVGTFDEAFKSRVQLALHYPSLDLDGRWAIWSNFINGLRDTNPDAKVDELRRKIDILAKNTLNGREIRNTVKTAMQLAHYRKEPLEFSHFERVIEVANEFEKYLEETHGHTDDEWARAQKTRA